MARKTKSAAVYKVVINHEEQYIIQPESKATPTGFKSTGVTGSKDDCLAYVQKIWSEDPGTAWKVTVERMK